MSCSLVGVRCLIAVVCWSFLVLVLVVVVCVVCWLLVVCLLCVVFVLCVCCFGVLSVFVCCVPLCRGSIVVRCCGFVGVCCLLLGV